MAIRMKMPESAVDSCPIAWCWRKPIHAQAATYPTLDPENNFGYSLRVQCSKHGWQDRGDGWTAEELRVAGLT